jgi:hypothetical protein
MVKRKIWLGMALLTVFLAFAPKKAYAGTCTCSINNDRQVYFVSGDCDVATEYAVCKDMRSWSGTGCDCKKKAESGLSANTCACYNDGSVTSNCQGETPIPFCEDRTHVCVCSKNGTSGGIPTPVQTSGGGGSNTNPFKVCEDKGKKDNVNTAFGCVPITMSGFVSWLLPILFGIAGGISFLLMVYGFILIATSSGDEKKVQGAKETITSAIVGLLFSIFAIFIFRLIAVNILKIPGIN